MIHGTNAFKRSSQCGTCVNDKVYNIYRYKHDNVVPQNRRVYKIKIRLRIALPKDTIEGTTFTMISNIIDVRLDSGATDSIFTAQVARDLRILNEIENCIPEKSNTSSDTIRHIKLLDRSAPPCCRYDLSIFFCGKYQKVPVYWPIDPKNKKLLDDIPAQGNLLGMAGILSKNMLCLTPETLYVFPVLESKQNLT